MAVPFATFAPLEGLLSTEDFAVPFGEDERASNALTERASRASRPSSAELDCCDAIITPEPCHVSEYSYDPLTRWNALGHTLREPRGAKTVDELKALRVNDPSYGSLAPTVDRPSAHELSYDPLTRWNALGWAMREPRGAKTVDELKALRVNDPSYGSLAPTVDRPSAHEYSYDPLTRWNALGRTLREPRGAKSRSHLVVLRVNNPCYGSLLPSICDALPLLPEAERGRGYATLASLRSLAGRSKSPITAAREVAAEIASEAREEEAPGEEGWSVLTAGEAPKLLAAVETFSFDAYDGRVLDPFEEVSDDEDSDEFTSALPSRRAWPRRALGASRDSLSSDEGWDAERASNARTERASNHSDVDAIDEPPSPMRKGKPAHKMPSIVDTSPVVTRWALR